MENELLTPFNTLTHANTIKINKRFYPCNTIQIQVYTAEFDK